MKIIDRYNTQLDYNNISQQTSQTSSRKLVESHEKLNLEISESDGGAKIIDVELRQDALRYKTYY